MDNNYIKINSNECKGCELCITACNKNSIVLSSDTNDLGYQYAEFKGAECTACGFCYYICPEPGAITVYQEN